MTQAVITAAATATCSLPSVRGGYAGHDLRGDPDALALARSKAAVVHPDNPGSIKEVAGACLAGRRETAVAVRPSGEGIAAAWRAVGRSGAAGHAVAVQQRDDRAQGEALDLRAQLCSCTLHCVRRLRAQLALPLSRCCRSGLAWGCHGGDCCKGMCDGSSHARSGTGSPPLDQFLGAPDRFWGPPTLGPAVMQAALLIPARCASPGNGGYPLPERGSNVINGSVELSSMLTSRWQHDRRLEAKADEAYLQ